MLRTLSSRLKSVRGVTLFELLVVLVIIGISLGIISLYIGRGSGSRELRTFTRDLSAVLRYARNHAVSEKKTACLVADNEELALRLYIGDAVKSNGDDNPAVISRELPAGFDVTLPDSRGGVQFIEFFPQGSSTGGTIEINGPDGVRADIEINRINGKIAIKKTE